jgi:hypothetical protein
MPRLRDAYDTIYEAGKVPVPGTTYAVPGHNPMDALDRAVDLAVPIFDVAVTCNGAPVSFARGRGACRPPERQGRVGAKEAVAATSSGRRDRLDLVSLPVTYVPRRLARG